MSEQQTSNLVLKKADAYCWMAHWGGESRGYVPADGNWVKYGNYVALWDAYQALRHEIKGLRATIRVKDADYQRLRAAYEGRLVASRTVADLAGELRQIMERDGLDSTGIENAARELEWAGRRGTQRVGMNGVGATP